MNIETKLVQAGVSKDQSTGAISMPIYQSATFSHPELGKSTGFDYSRTANPTRKVLEETIASLEEGHAGFAFSSGMAAITTVLLMFNPGDHIVISNDLYGGTYRLLEENFKQYGITTTYTDTSSITSISKEITEQTVAIFIETPSNPLMKITNLEAVCQLARENHLLTIVDNTFLTPYLQRPIPLGADIIIHSASKYLSGHNDVIAGLVVTATESLSEKIGRIQNSTGAILGPQDSWLVVRGMKTLAVRLEKQQINAEQIADFLNEHPLVKNVFYPKYAPIEQKEWMEFQSKGYGAMLSFEVVDESLVAKLLKKVNVIRFAESLGGVESLITYPATQTHADIPLEVREAIGVSNLLLRLSVGIENIEDLIADLDQALNDD